MTEINEIAVPILKQVLKEAQDAWHAPDSKYREYRTLQIDRRGSFGERFFEQTLSRIYYRRLHIEYKDGDQGDWDLKFNGVKFEVKTASLDVNGKFQNEGIKEQGDYDGILFLGIAPNQTYVKFVRKDEIDFSKLHNRGGRGTGRGHKWDFKLNEITAVNSLDEVKNEFEAKFGGLLKLKK